MSVKTATGRHVARSWSARYWVVCLAAASLCACSNDAPRRAHAGETSRFDVAGAQR